MHAAASAPANARAILQLHNAAASFKTNIVALVLHVCCGISLTRCCVTLPALLVLTSSSLSELSARSMGLLKSGNPARRALGRFCGREKAANVPAVGASELLVR